jgi:hypothetical protein
MEEALAGLFNELRCAICAELYTSPVSLPCACVFCDACVRDALSGKGVFLNECPLCQHPTYLRDLRANTQVAALVTLLSPLAEAAGDVPASSEADIEALCSQLVRWSEELDQAPSEMTKLEAAQLQRDVDMLEAGLQLVHMRLRQLKIPGRWRASGTEESPHGQPGPSCEGAAAERVGSAPLSEREQQIHSMLESSSSHKLKAICANLCAEDIQWRSWSVKRMRTELAKCVSADVLQSALELIGTGDG